MTGNDMHIPQPDGSVVDYNSADGYGVIRMGQKLTLPETQCYGRGFNAGHRNRRLAMGLPRDPETLTPLGVDGFNNEAYGTGYCNGWREADIRIRSGRLGVLPCAKYRELAGVGG